jgi:hypothetical protein
MVGEKEKKRKWERKRIRGNTIFSEHKPEKKKK